MFAEIITIGDELLIGQVVDTNSAWMGQELNKIGIEVLRIVSIRDREEEIMEAVDNAMKRVNIVLVTGGLGPTKDDITKQTLCKYFHTELIFSEEVFENVKRVLAGKIPMNALNKSQAMVPKDCTVINNTGYKMARDGQWVVWMGMWTSTAVLAPLGAFLTYKSNNDSVVLNADAYINWFKKVVGIRSVRHLFRKEVIIHDPDYTRIPEELKALSVDCREYADRKGLKRAPNYFKLWMTDSQDEAVEDINERLESLIDEMSNTRSVTLLTALNTYPVIPIHAHVRPFRNYWLNLLCGIVFPIGLFFYFRIWAFRIRLNKDMERIIKTNEDVIGIIERDQNK